MCGDSCVGNLHCYPSVFKKHKRVDYNNKRSLFILLFLKQCCVVLWSFSAGSHRFKLIQGRSKG